MTTFRILNTTLCNFPTVLQLAKYPRVLYVKPSNEMLLKCLQLTLIFCDNGKLTGRLRFRRVVSGLAHVNWSVSNNDNNDDDDYEDGDDDDNEHCYLTVLLSIRNLLKMITRDCALWIVEQWKKYNTVLKTLQQSCTHSNDQVLIRETKRPYS